MKEHRVKIQNDKPWSETELFDLQRTSLEAISSKRPPRCSCGTKTKCVTKLESCGKARPTVLRTRRVESQRCTTPHLLNLPIVMLWRAGHDKVSRCGAVCRRPASS